MIKRTLKTGLLLLCAGLLALAVSSCGDVDDETLTIDLSADKTEMPPDGASSVAITAKLTNDRGEPAIQGTDVQFITNLGTFSNGKNYFTIPDDTGEVTVALIAGTIASDAEVKATANDTTQIITITFAPLE